MTGFKILLRDQQGISMPTILIVVGMLSAMTYDLYHLNLAMLRTSKHRDIRNDFEAMVDDVRLRLQTNCFEALGNDHETVEQPFNTQTAQIDMVDGAGGAGTHWGVGTVYNRVQISGVSIELVDETNDPYRASLAAYLTITAQAREQSTSATLKTRIETHFKEVIPLIVRGRNLSNPTEVYDCALAESAAANFMYLGLPNSENTNSVCPVGGCQMDYYTRLFLARVCCREDIEEAGTTVCTLPLPDPVPLTLPHAYTGPSGKGGNSGWCGNDFCDDTDECRYPDDV